MISIHALRGEGDRWAAVVIIAKVYFYPRPPWGGRLKRSDFGFPWPKISIHALRGEGDGLKKIYQRGMKISIHALRGEGDRCPARTF